MKRQRGRNRNGGGNKPQQQNANRAFDSNGPEGIKVRGNAQHVFDKYQQLARDAASGGDRVLAENYLQHAEHYFRVIRAVTPMRPVADIVGRDAFISGNDIDFEDESGAQAYVETAPEGDAQSQGGDQPRQDYRHDGQRQDGQRRDDRPRDRFRDDRPRDDRPRDDRPRDDRPRDDRPREDRYRDDRPRDDRPRDDRPRDDRPRDDRPRDDRSRDDRPRYRDRDRNREDRPPREDRPDPMAVVEPQAAPLSAPMPPREPSPAFSAADEDHLPAFLKVRPKPAAEPAEAAPEETKPRRRRAAKAESEG